MIDVIADKVLNQLLLRSNVVNNALTTEEGYALDARMGKSLQDQITAQNSNTVKTIDVDSSDTNSQIITEWVWNLGDTHKLVVSCKKHDGTVINMFVDLKSQV